MPRIINYLDRVRAARVYSEDELARLQSAYDRACRELKIGKADGRRETLAGLIFHVADESVDADEVYARAVALFRQTTDRPLPSALLSILSTGPQLSA